MSELNSENIYFTNDVDDLDFIKNCLNENSIPHEIIFNNNSHPIFGTNMALIIFFIQSILLCFLSVDMKLL